MGTERGASVLDRRTRFALWVRRPGSWVEIAAWAALAAFVVWTIGPALIGHGTFLNTGLLGRYTPWGAVFQSTTTPTNILNSDTIDTVAPQTSLLTRLAHEGVFGAWNPYVAGGAELGGVPDSGAWSPLALPWWILPLAAAPGWVKLLEVVVVTVGMSLLLRRWGVPRAGWAIAALVYSSSGFMVAWSNWPQTRVAACIPLLFWAIDRAAVELRARDVIAVGVPLASMLLGGFPAIVGYALFIGGLYFLVRTIVAHRRWVPVVVSGAIAVGGILFGLLLSAWQLVPFAINASSLVDFSGRGQSGPNGLGTPPLVSAWVPDISFVQSTGPAWGIRNPVEEYSYLGIAAVVLVAVAVLIRPATHTAAALPDDATPAVRARHDLARRRTRGVVAIVASMLALAVVIVYLGGPVLSAVRELPVFDTNPIGRARVVVMFLAAAMAGVGFGRLVQPENLRDELARFRAAGPLRRTGRIAAVAVVLFTAVGVGMQTLLAIPPIAEEYVHRTKLEILAVGILGAVTVVLVVLVWVFRSRVLATVAAIGVVALVVVPAVTATKPWWPIAPSSTFYPTTPAIDYLQEHVSAQDRYAATGSAMLPGSSSYYRIRETTGHAFQTGEWKDLMRAVDPDTYPTATYLTFEPNLMPSLARSGILDRLSTKYLVADPSGPLAGTAEPGAAQTKWSDLTAENPSVDSASNTGPVNGITFTGPPAPTLTPGGMTLDVAIIADDSGKTITSTSTHVPGLGGPRNVALQGSTIPTSTSWHVRITVTGQDKLVPIGTDDAGDAVMSITRPVSGDGVRVVHTGDATIYERGNALDRVRWASGQVVERTGPARVRALADQSLPDSTVVLSAPSEHTADPDSSAEITLRDSDVNSTVAEVDATGSGWVVVSDSLQRAGWTATVDGEPTDLVAADDAGAAVWVPGGEHTVELRYAVPGARTGYLLTGGSIVLAVLACTVVTLLVRRRRRRGDDAAGL
ncbi:hypothetical protein [Curtobacterium flaccumfaciens]|uniref:hypothetical protein n=1 Tax=Curtobacterium flaccumfaciens TaxID=2035 RepID=UPI001BDE24D0|nr:hypothetical protein [Curtobacterium flaccumfaciens]MBT1605213.1 hypothetical protein [Curtobacterium flaccumfaciens pv. betae]MBT1655683.1 hypothetical protein [Curtobacterium flaccumfaciens pv. betae]MCS0470567.1 hypothetical protein [Curtobacterium flaccumfaciens pv. betae]MCS0474243.1 hypothetical protein [Curtobacterium flaccumfaciens pv. betae]MCS0478564.1 hypothetical protein [Curtobacterium flaccumfaciens pv. betae]